MNKYEVEIEKLKNEWEYKGKQYAAEAQQINNVAMQYCNQFNSQITIVNVERHLMRREINTLYKFLKQFGDIGIKVTPFDFVAEDWLFPNANVVKNKKEIIEGKIKKDSYPGYREDLATAAVTGSTVFGAARMFGAARTAASVASTAFVGSSATSAVMTGYIAASMTTVGMALPVFAPIALPTYLVIKDFKKKSDSKDVLLKMQNEFDKDCAKWENSLNEMKDEISFFVTAVQMADMYRGLVATVRDTIADKILPELNGIMAFLYADAIKNCIINNEDPTTVAVGNISEYRGTPYERHYLFIKNVFEYYTLITTFFTKPVLTDLIEKRNVSEKEVKEFLIEIEKIEAHRHELMRNCVIGGELL